MFKGKGTNNRGFFYGAKEDTPVNWDLNWKHRVAREDRLNGVMPLRSVLPGIQSPSTLRRNHGSGSTQQQQEQQQQQYQQQQQQQQYQQQQQQQQYQQQQQQQPQLQQQQQQRQPSRARAPSRAPSAAAVAPSSRMGAPASRMASRSAMAGLVNALPELPLGVKTAKEAQEARLALEKTFVEFLEQEQARGRVYGPEDFRQVANAFNRWTLRNPSKRGW